MTRKKDPAEIRTPVAAEAIPAFDVVPRKFRHDGWTPRRQRAFIGALADTGSVSRAARHVNMSPEGAYYLRRQAGSESFRRAWEAALDLGVQRLKDVAYERAIDGQLVPVFVAGKLKGFRRVRNDRLLMFCLRMNARDEQGKRLSASYFDPGAERLTGSGASMTMPALSRAEKDDMNAAIVEHFDPVAMTLPEIEAMQAQLAKIAQRKRAEEDGPPDHDTDPAFVQLRGGTEWKEAGSLEGLEQVEDELEPWDEDEDHWQTLG
ncbi:hypothetical protein [Qipengyuania marisflavi]|uniref:Terminase small subunit n=1 Tax=Qipengyuania marisflavi TaxID=2486356 RepID=A0A5S3P9F7_9SPHN|nr:hypothetical protein [Qipengyuania marisflavi]TMM50088.1 hypothetical protein FEV51_02525 [Qipengyuania marisflavi]